MAEREIPAAILALGQPEAVFFAKPSKAQVDERTLRRAGQVMAAIGIFLAAIGAALYPLYDGPMIGVAILGGLAAIPGLFFVFVPVERPSFLNYALFAEAIATWEEDQISTYPWDQIAEFYGGKLVMADGRELILHETDGAGRSLSHQVAERAVERLRGPALATLAKGRPVAVGPFVVRRESITHKGQTVLWGDIDKIAVVTVIGAGAGAYLRINLHGPAMFPWCNLEMTRIPSSALLIDLIEHVCPAHLLKKTTRACSAKS